MNIPQTDNSPSELFLKLLEPQPSEVIDFPRKGPDGKPISKIRIQVLPHEQHDRARETAFKALQEKGYSAEDLQHVSMREVAADRIAKELIAISCLTAESQFPDANTGDPVYGRIFRNGEEVGKLRSHEVTTLFSAYMLVQEKYGPHEHMSKEHIDAWIKKLTEGGEMFPLLSLDLPELASLTLSFSERISSMSRVLESQWKELPDTCKSHLEKFSLGTGYWSLPLDESEETSMESFDIHTEDAVALSDKLTAQDRLSDMLGIED